MKKMCPFDRWDIIRIRQWLNEYASLGYRLTSWGFFVRFEEESDFYGQYQIDVDNMGSLNPNEERRSELEKLGWDYVTSIEGTRCHIYCHEDRKAVMPVNQVLAEYNCKKFRSMPFLAIVAMVLAILPESWEAILKYPFWMVELSAADKIVPILWGIFMLGVLYFVVNDIWRNYRIHQYFREITKLSVLEPDHHSDAIGMRVPVLSILIILIYFTVLVVAAVWDKVDTRNYVEGYFSERYYSDQAMEEIYPFLEQYRGFGSYWMNVSENSDEKLFDQIVERYAGYGDYYGGVLHKKDDDTHDDFLLTEMKDERFERLVIAEGIEGKEKSTLIFVQKENDILYLRVWDDIDFLVLLKEIAKPAKL